MSNYGVYRPLVLVVDAGLLVPLSNVGPASNVPLWITLSIAVHVLLIGVPIALFAGRALASAVPAGT